MTEEELQSKIDDLLEPTTKYLYVLEGKKVVPCKRMRDWARMFDKENLQDRTVAITYTACHKVSTVFIGMEGFEKDDEGNPLVFETMVFGDGGDTQECYKSGTWKKAQSCHLAVLVEVLGEECESN